MDTIIYNQDGKKTGTIALPESVFGVSWNPDVVHQVSQAMLSNRRQGSAHTKNRGEVSGGGKKPWKQKGTGRARHGSTRSPIWVGGGVAHGPRNDRNYDRKINRTLKRKALGMVLSKKLKEGEILLLSNLVMPEIKAKEAKTVLGSLSKISGFSAIGKSKNAAFVILPAKNKNVEKSFQNFNNLSVGEARNLNVVDVLTYKYLVIANPEECMKSLV